MYKQTFLLGMAAAMSLISIAHAEEGDRIEYLNSKKIFPSTYPFSEAVRVGKVLYLSGQIGVAPGASELSPGGIDGESRQAMENIKTILEAHGYGMENLVKCTVMLADMSEWNSFNDVYREYFSDRYPARSTFGASGLALGGRVEIECIAATE